MSQRFEPIIVRQGDHVAKLAFLRGADPEEVWNHPSNSDLRAKRPSMDVLYPGDVLHLPRPKPTALAFQQGDTHRFVARVPKRAVKLLLSSSEGPYANEPYEVVGAQLKAAPNASGVTGPQGEVTLQLPITAREVQLLLRGPNVTFLFRVGDVDPIDEQGGPRKRLENLGLLERGTAPSTEAIESAVRTFKLVAASRPQARSTRQPRRSSSSRAASRAEPRSQEMKVTYKWTPRDHQREAAGYSKSGSAESQLVTPYGHLPGNLPNAKSFEVAGTAAPVTIDLDLAFGLPGWRERFFTILNKNTDKSMTLSWEEIPAELLGPSTLGELCRALHKARPNAYPAYLYADSELSGDPAKDKSFHLKMPQLLFDHWDNTVRRHKTITGGAFSYSMSAREIPVDKATQWRALTLKPKPVPAAVKVTSSGSGLAQSIISSADIAALESEVANLRALATQAINLTTLCEREMFERAKVLAPFNALHVMFRCCGGSQSVTGEDGTVYRRTGSGTARDCDAAVELLDKILEVAKEKMFEAPIQELAGAAPVGLDPRVAEAMRKLQGYSTDAAADLDALCDKLNAKLFDTDSCFKLALKKVFGAALSRGELDSPPVRGALANAVSAMSLALEALTNRPWETPGSDDLWAMLKGAEKGPAKTQSEMSDSSATELVLSLVSYSASHAPASASISLSIVGNLEGPPSLSVALTHLTALKAFPDVAKAMASGDKSKLTALKSNLRSALAGYKFSKLDDLYKAIDAKDTKQLQKLREEFEQHVLGSTQTSIKWKAFTNVLQLVAVIPALETASTSYAKLAEDEGDPVANVLDLASSTSTIGQFTLGVSETTLTLIGKWGTSSGPAKAVMKAARAAGYIGAIIGFLQGAYDLVEGLDEMSRGGRPLRAISGGLTMLGNGMLIAGMMTANPQALALGMGLILAGQLVDMVDEILKAEEGSRGGTAINRIGRGVLRYAHSPRLFWAIYPHIKHDLSKLQELVNKGDFPYAAHSPLIIESLRRVGFDAAQISEIVGGAVTFDPNLMRGRPAHGLILPPPTS
ncbi:MAG: hypothetical protein IPG04_12620 [Polyangiaceae bacterium]|nr:hypothetical protein [Polyangiaceae bacterium]